MIMRRRPLLRAAAVAGGAYVAGKRVGDQRARDEQAYAEQTASATPAAASDPGPPAASLSDQLGELTRMRDQGMLTDEEFSAAKAKLLGI